MEMVFIILLGLVIGSFCNVLIDRLPKGETVLWGRSHCDYCKKPLRWFELIPVVSFILQRGACRRCHKRLSLQYPAVEVISAFILVILYTRIPCSSPSSCILSLNIVSLISSCLIAYSFFVIFVADVKEQIIPDTMLVVAVAGIIMGDVFNVSDYGLRITDLYAALSACLFFFLLWLVTKGRGMGLGDVKLAFVLGLFLGFPGILIACYAAFLTGAIVGVILILLGYKTLKSKIAFGPFLLLGTMISVIWGPYLWMMWRNYI